MGEESSYPYANKRKCLYGPYSFDGPVHAATYKTQHNTGALMRVIITIIFLIIHSLPDGLQTTEPPQLQLKSQYQVNVMCYVLLPHHTKTNCRNVGGKEGGKCNYNDKGRSITNNNLLYTKTNERNKTWVINSILIHM